MTLASLFTLGIGDDGISGADAEEGITYKEYLRAFLFLQPEEETTMRTIDRIEENMRLEQNCEKFRADHCVTKCEIRNKVEIFGSCVYISVILRVRIRLSLRRCFSLPALPHAEKIIYKKMKGKVSLR